MSSLTRRTCTKISDLRSRKKKKKTSGRFSHGTDQPDNLSLDGLGPKPD